MALCALTPSLAVAAPAVQLGVAAPSEAHSYDSPATPATSVTDVAGSEQRGAAAPRASVFSPGLILAAKAGTEVVVRNPLSQHAIERMAERGITRGQVDAAIRKGTQYYDRRNGTIAHVLEGGFASGRTLLVGTNPSSGLVTTVISSRRFNPLVEFNGSRRFVPVP